MLMSTVYAYVAVQPKISV